MILTSHGTGGARRRLRVHCGASRDLVCRGGGDAVLEVDATDGRTYRLRLSRDDWGVLMEAAAEEGL